MLGWPKSSFGFCYNMKTRTNFLANPIFVHQCNCKIEFLICFVEEGSHDGKSAQALGSHNTALDATAWPSVVPWAPSLHLFNLHLLIYKRASKLWALGYLAPNISRCPVRTDLSEKVIYIKITVSLSRLGYLLAL